MVYEAISQTSECLSSESIIIHRNKTRKRNNQFSLRIQLVEELLKYANDVEQTFRLTFYTAPQLTESFHHPRRK
jgi:hypothetical protein